MTDGLVPSIAKRGDKPYDRNLSPLKISLKRRSFMPQRVPPQQQSPLQP